MPFVEITVFDSDLSLKTEKEKKNCYICPQVLLLSHNTWPIDSVISISEQTKSLFLPAKCHSHQQFLMQVLGFAFMPQLCPTRTHVLRIYTYPWPPIKPFFWLLPNWLFFQKIKVDLLQFLPSLKDNFLLSQDIFQSALKINGKWQVNATSDNRLIS